MWNLQAQDTLPKKKALVIERDSATLFGHIGINDGASDEAKLLIGGYVSAYYAYYTDEITNNGLVQIPVMAPRNKEFGLNMALLSMQYSSKNVRGNFGLQFGDIPKAIWPTEFNMIQEANAGVRLIKGLWFDAGVFRSHIGVESIQPRENITSSTSLVNNYEPYYFSGAKLTYVLNSKLSLQVNAFNSFNTITETNKDKLFGFSAVYDRNEKISITYNFLTGDESADTVILKQRRYYNNIYATIKLKKFILALEANYGWQENSMLKNMNGTASLYSGLIVARYQFVKKSALYVRGEYLSDPDCIVTGALNFGNNVMGTTAGVEYKPYKNVALSIEGRVLQSDKTVFKESNYKVNQRYESIFCLDVSF
ncbi:MAG: porin [Sphingobacteriaceae bacterium]|nr:porin [Sphingobacteriaceae bacterium]